MSIIIYSCETNASSMKGKDVDNGTALEDLGFGKSPSALKVSLERQRIKWESKYQLQFISDADLTKICTSNQLIQGRASDYVAEIPVDAQKRIITNYDKIKNDKDLYHLDKYNSWKKLGIDWYGDKGDKDKGILVIAPPQMFIPGADINNKKDPMAVVKTSYGYVVIAAW